MEDSLLEDGEIADSESFDEPLPADNKYLVSHQKREPKTICSDESSNDNSDESDDDSDTQCSKPKKTKPEPQLPMTARRKVPDKYKVWSTTLQEEALMENLNKCDVESMDRERSVESYNYKLFQRIDNSSVYSDEQMSSVHDRLGDFICEDEDMIVVGSKRRHRSVRSRRGHKRSKIRARCLPELSKTAKDPSEEVAFEIAENLRENKFDLIMNIVLVLGKQKSIDLYNETKNIEANGGIMLMSGERRKTSGGVYLLLLKRDDKISSEDMKSIFADEKLEQKNKLKAIKRVKLDKLKESLIREKLLSINTDSNVPRAEAAQSDAPLNTDSNNLEDGEIELTVTNPPPSPATDQDTPPSLTNAAYSEDEADVIKTDHCVSETDNQGRKFVTYDDSDEEYLKVDLEPDDMDVF